MYVILLGSGIGVQAQNLRKDSGLIVAANQEDVYAFQVKQIINLSLPTCYVMTLVGCLLHFSMS